MLGRLFFFAHSEAKEGLGGAITLNIPHSGVFSDRDPCIKTIIEDWYFRNKKKRARGYSQEHLKDGGENHADDNPDIEANVI